MKIITTNRELTKKEKYELTSSPAIQKMTSAKGSVLEIDAFAIYTDANKDGVEQDIISIKTTDGEVFATNSATFIREFRKMLDMFDPDPVTAVMVGTGVSKAGREFITAVYAGD